MNNQEEKEIVLLSDFCWVLFDREQRHRLQKKEEDTTRARDDDDSLGGGSRSFPLESSYHHHHHHHHHRECISKRERKRHNVPSLRRQSIFADVRIFPRGVPVDFTERLAPRRRTMMMIPMLHLYGPFVRLRAHSKQMMRALCAAAAARRKGVDDDDDSNRRPNKSLSKTKDDKKRELKDCVVVVKVDRRNAPCSSQKDEGLFFNAVSQKTDLFPFRRN